MSSSSASMPAGLGSATTSPASFTSGLALSRSELDRDHLGRRGDHLFERLRADANARFLPVHGGLGLLRDGSETELVLLPASEAPAGFELYLGRTTVAAPDAPLGAAVVAVEVDDDAAAALNGEWADLRRIGDRLSDRDAGMLTEAVGMFNWHASFSHSPRTGSATTPAQGGWTRLDPADGREIFPRTDPAIIVGIIDADDRILLGSNAMWPNNRWSILAGFVEPGESLEAAVIREVFEESGVRVVDPVYLGSQPWPFPASLMLGFTASVAPDAGPDLEPDGDEILDLRWFSREELAASLGDVLLPGPTSIAHAIIERWYGRPLRQEGRF